jgi:hypothetical protein
MSGPHAIDDKLKQKLLANGIDWHTDVCSYNELSTERLEQYNNIIAVYPPNPGQKLNGYRKSFPQLLSYVKSGGGLIITTDENYNSYKILNELLVPLGAEILPETPVDTARLYQQENYFQHYYCSTTNIKQHPVTEKVQTLWYPLAHHPDEGRATQIIKLDSSWLPLISAESSAYYFCTKDKEQRRKHYDTAKCILAARQYGKGRIIVFATRVLNYLHSPYHQTFAGICLDRGEGLRLVRNMLTWSSNTARQMGAPGGYIQQQFSKSMPKVPLEKLKNLDYYQRRELILDIKPVVLADDTNVSYTDGLKDYIGLIGAHSNYSTTGNDWQSLWHNSIKQYCQAAKDCGYDYIVFTEIFENMTEDKWNHLRSDCAAESTDTFIAIPGIEIADILGDRWAVFDMKRWPDPENLDESKTRIANSPIFYFSLSHDVTSFLPRYLLLPRSSMRNPWENKFYAGLEVFSYMQGRKFISEDLDDYLRCQSNDFNLIPITTHRLYSPNEIYNAQGMLTHVKASSVQDIVAMFRYGWYAQRNVYLSDGPTLSRWSIENGRHNHREDQWKIIVSVKNDVPLHSVTIYDRQKVFRRFLPDSSEFKTTIRGYHAKQQHFVLIAEDINGHKLVSPALYVSDKRHSMYMCTDLQNIITSCWEITPEGEEYHYKSMDNPVTLWDSILVPITTPLQDVLPNSGIEFGYGGWQLSSSAFLQGLKGNCWAQAARDMALGSGDCCILRNIYDVTLLKNNLSTEVISVDNIAEHHCYTPRVGGLNIRLVRQSVKLLQDFTLPGNLEYEFLQFSGTNLANGKYPNYLLVDNAGQKKTGVRDSKMSLDVDMTPGSFFCAYPDMWGSFAVMPVNDNLHLRVRGSSVHVGHKITESLKASTTFDLEAIFICGKYGSIDEADFEYFATAFGLTGKPFYTVKMKHGKVISNKYILKIQSQNSAAIGNIGPAPMGNDLPINIHGLNENWDAGMLDLNTGTLRRICVYEGKGIFQHDIDSTGLNFACGNMIMCDNSDIRLNIFNDNGLWRINAHNPTADDIQTRIRTSSWLKKVAPKYNQIITIPAGSTTGIELK